MRSRRAWIAMLAGVACLGWELPAAPELRAEEAPLVFASTDAFPRDCVESQLRDRQPALGDRIERVATAVMRCDDEHQVPADLVLSVILVESGGRPWARSPKGALGLMQVMPYMFDALELPGNALHIESNIEAGCLVLADNIRRLGQLDGISSYFWGSRIKGDGYLRRVLGMRESVRGACPPAERRA